MPDKYRMTPDDRDLVIRTIIGEAADQPEEGQAAVGHVIMNRLRSGRHGSSPSDVVLARGQFEPWQTRARELMSISPKSPQYRRVGDIFDRVAGGDHEDPTGGATHFLEENIVRRRRGGSLPDWASGTGQRIGDHTFYAPEGRALGYAGEPGATTIPGQPGERSASTPPGRTRLAQTGVTPEDIAETLRQAGIGGGDTSPRAPVPTDNDIAETLRQAGIVMSKGTQPVTKDRLTEPPASKLGPTGQKMAEQRAAEMGPAGAIVEGVPIFGPAVARGFPAATGAAFPSTGSMPGATFGERFTGNRAVMDEAARLYAERNPGMSLAGDLLGSTALTGAGALTWPTRMAMGMEGANTASKVYTGMIGNSAINSLDAALRNESVPNAAMIGAAGGAAGPLVSAGVSGLGRAYNKLPVTTGPLAGMNSVAREKLAGALEGETAGSIAASRQRMGPAGFFGDINQATTDIAGGIADTPGMGKALVRGAYTARDAGQRGRIDTALTRAVGPHTDIEGFKKFTTEARKAAADPLYEQWRTMEVKPTDELKALIPRLEEAGAFKMAEELSGISGRKINKAFFTGGPRKEFPTTESWDYVKRGLDRRIDQAYAGGDKTLARELVNLKHEMIDEIGKTPAGAVWKQARQEFASRSSILDQIEAGQDTFLGGRSGLSVDELRHELKGLNGPELAARLQGLRAAADRVMGDTLTGDTSLRNKMLAPNNQAKMRLLLGQQRANELIESMTREKFLKEQTSGIVHGTQTTPKKERVDALKPPPHSVPNFNLTAPATWIPTGWSPSEVLHAARSQRHADAVNQLAGVVTRPDDSGMDHLLAAISAEASRRQRNDTVAGGVGNLLSTILSGPATTTARRHYFPTQ